MNLFKVKIRSEENIAFVYVVCNWMGHIETLLLNNRVKYDKVLETQIIAEDIIVEDEGN